MMTLETPEILWTHQDAEAATGGTASGSWNATGISIDSRTLVPGDLFVAIKGPNFDGHKFAAAAIAAGACAVVIDKQPDDLGDQAAVLRVGDALQALCDLGIAARARTQARIIAVTGSVGKTGSKEALNFVLSRQAQTSANLGSLNNHWGLPLSLARMPEQATFGIFEMGMNHPGEITPLSKMARPHVALVTNVEAVHSEFFENVESIADAKAEIFAGVEAGGMAVLNRDNDHFHRLAEVARSYGVDRVIGFGVSDDADFRLIEESRDTDGSSVTIDINGHGLSYRLGVAGHHWVMNSLGVLAAVAAAGGNVGEAARSFADLSAPRGRGQVHHIAIAGHPFTLIDESYNASPVSMNASFEVLGQAQPGSGGRRIAVLGDMRELGAESSARHAGLAEPLKRNGIDLVFAAGPDMAHLFEALDPALRGGHGESAEVLLPTVLAAIGPGDVVMVKGSFGSRTGLIVNALLAEAETPGAMPPRAVNGH